MHFCVLDSPFWSHPFFLQRRIRFFDMFTFANVDTKLLTHVKSFISMVILF